MIHEISHINSTPQVHFISVKIIRYRELRSRSKKQRLPINLDILTV